MELGKLSFLVLGLILFAALGLSQGLDTSSYDALNTTELTEEKSNEENLRVEIKDKIEDREEELNSQEREKKSSEGFLSSFINSLF